MFQVSVIIPTYNRWHTLPRAIESVLNQTRPVDEIVIVDDGSVDDTVNQLATRYPQLRVYHQPQAGVSAARNLGIGKARNDWIALLDSDDEWLPHKIEKQRQILEENPELKICHTEEIWVRNGRRVNPMKKHQKQGGWIYEQCLPLCAMSPSAILFHRSVIDDVGVFDETLPACEDYDLWLRMCCRYPVAFVSEPCVVKYGGHGDQLSKKYWGMDRFRIKSLVKLLESGDLSESQQALTRQMLRYKVNIVLQGAEKRGKREQAAAYRGLLQRYSGESG